ncbi:hypothetical protein PybrP1_010199 [[Pythium] brassicae (nom. inval.)]|nr:hypothetical protein PybrP1_010199 [[Pythium] brassicae (nom. inval.)]
MTWQRVDSVANNNASCSHQKRTAPAPSPTACCAPTCVSCFAGRSAAAAHNESRTRSPTAACSLHTVRSQSPNCVRKKKSSQLDDNDDSDPNALADQLVLGERVALASATAFVGTDFGAPSTKPSVWGMSDGAMQTGTLIHAIRRCVRGSGSRCRRDRGRRSRNTLELRLRVEGQVAQRDHQRWRHKARSVQPGRGSHQVDLQLKAYDISGQEMGIDKFKGKVLLVVNVSRNCELMALSKPHARGAGSKAREHCLEILASPCNQFAFRWKSPTPTKTSREAGREQRGWAASVHVNDGEAAVNRVGIFVSEKLLVDRNGQLYSRVRRTTSDVGHGQHQAAAGAAGRQAVVEFVLCGVVVKPLFKEINVDFQVW